jgi:hypothetical protein
MGSLGGGIMRCAGHPNGSRALRLGERMADLRTETDGGPVTKPDEGSADQVLQLVTMLTLSVMILVLLVQVQQLRGDVRELRDSSQPTVVESSDRDIAEIGEVCRLLGSLAAAHDVSSAAVLSGDDGALGLCEEKAIAGGHG